MNLTIRYIIASCGLVALVLAWWFPTSVLIRSEWVDWGREYESAATAIPLTEFIAKQTEGRVVQGTNPLWAQVFAGFESDLAAQKEKPDARFFKPDQAPFNQLKGRSKYLEWRDSSGIRYLAYQRVYARDFADQPIPDALRFPLRTYWPVLLGGIVLIGYWGFFHRQKLTLVESSTSAQLIRGATVLIVIGVGLIVGPMICRVDSSFSLFSGMAGIMLLIVAGAMIWSSSREIALLRRLLEGQHYLAHFTYGADEWQRYAEWNFSQEMARSKSNWWLLFSVTLVASGIFLGMEGKSDKALWIVGGLSGSLMLFATVLAIFYVQAYRRHCAGPGEVYIGQQIVYLNGLVYSWGSSGIRLDLVELKTEPLPHLLLVLYSERGGSAPVRILVPAGQQEWVQRQVVEPLMQSRVESV